MKVKKFRIKNYKSIVDSGDCYLSDRITILAGKNESGKTAILEALEDFNVGVEIREKAKPIQPLGGNPEISVTFTIGEEVMKEILSKVKIPKSLEVPEEIELEIVKRFPNEYLLGESALTRDIFGASQIEKAQNMLRKKWARIRYFINAGGLNDLPGMELIEVNFSDFDETTERLSVFRAAVVSDDFKIRQIPSRVRRTFLAGLETSGSEAGDREAETIKQSQKFLLDSFDEVEAEMKEIHNLKNLSQQFSVDFFECSKEYIPSFSMVSSVGDTFPNWIAFSELEDNEWIKDLSVKCGLDVSKIQSSVYRTKRKHKGDVSNELNKDYESSWSQDSSTLSVDWDSEAVSFWIEENNHPYEPSYRSVGRQWHLAFHTRVSARSMMGGANVILIDEPGIFLHAKAQRDILKTMEAAAETVQVVFSTHSPYLIEADKLNRVKLILKDEKEGTTICNKVHVGADKETLTPIMTAIGSELSAGIAGFGRENNVVVEGASDVYYFNAFKKLLGKEEINFIFGGGSGNMPNIGTILRGWGARVIYLCDKDDGGKNGAKKLKSSWFVEEEDILYVLESKGSVEDIFSRDDFIKVVLKDHKDVSYSGSNSKYVKDSGLDKVLIAKQFLESCEDGLPKLDKESMGRVEQLFEKIEDRFKG